MKPIWDAEKASKRRLPTERACFHWLQQLELRFQRIFKKKRKKKRLFTSCLVSRAFPRHEEPKVDKKSQKIYLADFGQQYQQKIEKKEGKTRAGPYGWRSLKSKQHQNLALNSLMFKPVSSVWLPVLQKVILFHTIIKIHAD